MSDRTSLRSATSRKKVSKVSRTMRWRTAPSAARADTWRRPRSTRQRGACRPRRGAQDGTPALDGPADRNLDLKRGVAGGIRSRTVDDRLLGALDGSPPDVDAEREEAAPGGREL